MEKTIHDYTPSKLLKKISAKNKFTFPRKLQFFRSDGFGTNNNKK